MKRIIISIVFILFGSCILNGYSYAPREVLYIWENLKIGGGGYVTGIVNHPEDKDIMYIRTDVGGAYRWDKQDSSWIQMLSWVSPLNANLIGVDGLAIDPNNKDRVYLALGQRVGEEGGVFRSEDRGVTWKKILDATFEGNGRNARWIGECIAVDPNNSNIIYAGTRTDGLWRSVDDGKNWSKVATVPDGYTGNRSMGIRSVVFDPDNKIQGKTAVLYVGVPQYGIYKSDDGGDTFYNMEGSPRMPARMQVVDGELFVTHGRGLVYFANGSWHDITPSAGRNYVALAVDKTDSKNIVAAQRYPRFYNPIYRTSDKGETWQEINTPELPAILNVTIPWWPKNRFSSATAGMILSQAGSGELFYTDWFGVWQTPDVWADTTSWNTLIRGHEETVVLTMIAPAEGPLLYSGVADVSGFIHTNITDYTTQKLAPFNEIFSIAVCESQPAHVAILGAKSWEGAETTLLTSADYGKSWTTGNLPTAEKLGRISISSGDPSRMVYLAGSGRVYFSTDAGENWQPSMNAPGSVVELINIWNRNKVLAADYVDGSFYLIKGHVFYASDDGRSWEQKGLIPVTINDRHHNVLPVPGRAGEVWVSLGKDGLWKSTDKGKTFTQIEMFDNARNICWGAPAPDSSDPTAYVYGTFNGKWGMFRSVDMGESWKRINDDLNQFPAGVAAIDGDKKTFGRLYVGSGGYGISYGQPALPELQK